MDLEKNEVDISRLFKWGRVFEIIDDDDVVTLVYMRVLGDADVNKARVYALRESAKLRRALRDPDSDEYLSSIKDMEDLESDELVNMIILLSTRELTQRMWKQLKIQRPKKPKSDAPLEELEKYQKEIDEFPAKREKAVRDALEDEVNKLKKQTEKKNKKALYEEYKKLLTNELCEQRVIAAFREMSTFLGCYRDNEYKEKFFESFEEFMNLETSQKVEFLSAYQTLEVGTEELKKLREATQ